MGQKEALPSITPALLAASHDAGGTKSSLTKGIDEGKTATVEGTEEQGNVQGKKVHTGKKKGKPPAKANNTIVSASDTQLGRAG